MKGTKHEVYTSSSCGPGVGICNVDDDCYDCLLESPAEVNELIAQLESARDQVWPNHKPEVKE